MGNKTVGFLVTDGDRVENRQQLLSRVTNEDLEKFGLIPEFIGRIPVSAVLKNLEEEDLVHILTEPKNSLVKQYQKLFKFEKVKLSFTEEALQAVANRAATRQAGARGLRTILEQIMLEIMYEVPSQENIREVVITEEVVTEGATPTIEPVRDYGVPG
ncbi:MAG: ATP-dependent Clp protease ATP-binding subunit ClpX, partial [Myxococcota bacterium]|nr:ATP-dependent Clp protease ATP-binding subunit ClpX [Myxococcota bacterium]